MELAPRFPLREMMIRGPKGRDTRYSDTLRGQGGCSRIMSNPAPGQAAGQGSEAGSTHGAAVPSLQRTVQGSAAGTGLGFKVYLRSCGW